MTPDRRTRSRRPIIAQAVLGAIVVAGFFGVLVTSFLMDASAENGLRDARLMMTGALISALTQIVSYFFGSTSGSQEKTEMLARAMPPMAYPSTVIQTNDQATVTTQEQPR